MISVSEVGSGWRERRMGEAEEKIDWAWVRGRRRVRTEVKWGIAWCAGSEGSRRMVCVGWRL